MYKIAICDDEKKQIDTMLEYFDSYSKKYDISLDIDTFSSGDELIKEKSEKYSLIILDIQMNGLNGIETARIIRRSNKKSKIVFLTALEFFWDKGYEVNASRYLLKPIKEDELDKVMCNLIDEIQKELTYLTIIDKNNIIRILIKDIYYIEIVDRKTAVWIKEGCYYCKTKIDEFKKILSYHGFTYTHKSYLVNMNYVESIDKESVVLSGNNIVPVSRRKYKGFIDEFTNYVGGGIK